VVADPDLDRILDEAEARQLPSLVESWRDDPGARGWIAKALRLDLAFLLEHPAHVFAALYRRCAHLEADHDLRAAMQRWASRARRPWLRSIRPPATPLDASVIEEYRTDAGGDLAFSGNASIIGVIGGDVVVAAWDRATGRRCTPPRDQLRPPQSAWSHADSTFTRMVLEHGDRRIVAFQAEGVRPFRISEGNDLLVVDCDDGDDLYGRTYVVRPSESRIIWEVPVRCKHAGFIEDLVVVAHDDRVEARSARTGEVRCEWVSGAHPFDDTDTFYRAIAADGTIALRSGAVITIIDTAREVASEPAPRYFESDPTGRELRVVAGVLQLEGACVPCNSFRVHVAADGRTVSSETEQFLLVI
jgi:hypothetical protein